jgi:anaerobic magnesium-protoporphyrin IX monomethyl ester cyclase
MLSIFLQGRTMTKNRDPGKILFVTPPYHSGVVEASGNWIPLGLVYLAGAARLAGLEVEIYDAAVKKHGYRQIEKHLRGADADYIAVGAITATIDDALKTLELARKTRPDTVTILGGVHPTFMYEEVLGFSSAVDYIVIGEGETTLKLLLQTLRNGGDPATIPGLAFRRNGEVITTGRRALTEDLDSLPAAWDLLDWVDYRYLAIPGSRLGSVSTSRGCEGNCTFCSQQLFSEGSWRGRDPGKVADELAHLHRSYGVTVVMLTDEHPTRSRERWEALLDGIIARKLPIRLLLETRGADIIRDRDIMGKYREAGIVYVSCGVTTAGQELSCGQQASLDQPVEMKMVFDLLREQEIVSEGAFMIGLPDETPEHVRKTLQLAQEVNPDVANFLTFAPWPYAVGDTASTPSVKAKDYRTYSMVDTVITPSAMTMLQVDVAVADCYRRFYMGKIIDFMSLRPGFRRDFLLEVTKRFMASPFVLKKLGVGLFGAIPAKIGTLTGGER